MNDLEYEVDEATEEIRELLVEAELQGSLYLEGDSSIQISVRTSDPNGLRVEMLMDALNRVIDMFIPPHPEARSKDTLSVTDVYDLGSSDSVDLESNPNHVLRRERVLFIQT